MASGLIRMSKARVAPAVIPLGGGLRLVHIHNRQTGAAVFGAGIRAGSSDETTDCYGLAHFVEHTIFKGTRRRSSWHINNRMESVGGELNAFTTKESTVVYTVFPATETARAVELVADLTINSCFPARELDKEREVVVDEINSYLDSPSDAVFDDFEDLFFAGSGLGHNILGTPESVAGLGTAQCLGFLNRYYRAGNMVLFYSGPVASERVARLAERYFSALAGGGGDVRRGSVPVNERFDSVRCLPVHQSHVVAGARVPASGLHERYAAAMFANIVGGPGMNSLLNVELREHRGLVYSVEAGTTFFSDAGLLTVYFGCDPEDRGLCMRLCRGVFARLADGMTPVRLEKARKQYLGQFAIAGENNENRILAAARSTLFRGTPVSDAEVVEAVASVTTYDIAAVARAMLDASVLSFVPEKTDRRCDL